MIKLWDDKIVLMNKPIKMLRDGLKNRKTRQVLENSKKVFSGATNWGEIIPQNLIEECISAMYVLAELYFTEEIDYNLSLEACITGLKFAEKYDDDNKSKIERIIEIRDEIYKIEPNLKKDENRYRLTDKEIKKIYEKVKYDYEVSIPTDFEFMIDKDGKTAIGNKGTKIKYEEISKFGYIGRSSMFVGSQPSPEPIMMTAIKYRGFLFILNRNVKTIWAIKNPETGQIWTRFGYTNLFKQLWDD